MLKISYENLNSPQKESYNFQKVSAVLADYGFTTIRLSDDWQGADFIASHIDGVQFLKVQLKSRYVFDKKYIGKEIWICFPHKSEWYLYPHDDAHNWALQTMNLGKTVNKQKLASGSWSAVSPSKAFLQWLSAYKL